jgi:spore germination protein YaaH
MPWVQSVIAYATTQVPAAKLVLGIPAYGYDWASKGAGTSLTAPAAEQLAARVHATIRWDATAEEPTFTYKHGKISHTVWFDNAQAGYVRAALADEDKLAGVALWAAGDEDPQLWSELAQLQ